MIKKKSSIFNVIGTIFFSVIYWFLVFQIFYALNAADYRAEDRGEGGWSSSAIFVLISSVLIYFILLWLLRKIRHKIISKERK